MADSAAQAIWRTHLNRVAAAARRRRRARIATAIPRYDRGRDLSALLGGPLPPPDGILRALRAELRRQRDLRARGEPAHGPERLALLYAAWIVEFRLGLTGPGGTRPPH